MNPKRLIKFLTILISLLILVLTLVLLPVLINVLTDDPNIKSFSGGISTKQRIIIIGVVFIVAASATYLLTYFQQKSKQPVETKSPEDRFEENVEKFFNTLRENYDERHKHKLDERFEIPLGAIEIEKGQDLEELIREAPADAKTRPASELINDAFAKNECLLLLANSGVGKTVLLLNFANKRFRETASPREGAFPIIFNLASWSDEYKTKFEDWLVSVLVSNRDLEADDAQKLLRQGRVLLLLDGLDELGRNEGEKVAEKMRADCLKSLNRYLDRGQFAVICCSATQFAQMQKATGQDAPVARKILLMNLTKSEIEDAILRAYFWKEKGRLIDRNSANNLMGLLENEVFLEVIKTPFYFSTALEVFYQTIPEEKNLPASEEKIEKYLVEKFVEKKLEKTPNPHHFPPEKTIKWLKWLAEFMQKRPRVTFELSHLQPADISRRWIYYTVSSYFSLLPPAFVAGVVLIILIRTPLGLIVGLFFGLFFGLVPSLFDGSIKSLEFIVKEKLKPEDSTLMDYSELGWRQILSTGIHRNRFFWQKVLADGLVRGVGFGVTSGVIIGLIKGVVAGLFWGFVFCPVGILINALPGALKGARPEEVISTERVVKIDYLKIFKRDFWKQNMSRHTNRGMLGGVIFALIVYLFAISIAGFDIAALPGFMLIGLALGYLGGMGFGLVASFQGLKVTKEHAKIEEPYQRLRGGGLTNLMFLLFLVAVAFSSAAYFIYSNQVYTQGERILIVAYFLVIGFAMLQSLEALSKQALSMHVPLRLALYLEGATPLRYVKFLNYASDLRILERDGGQWRFRHQKLQTYFLR